MTPQNYLYRMIGFLVAIAALLVLISGQAIQFYETNIPLNSVIFGVLLLGVIYILRQVVMLGPEVRWFERFRRNDPALDIAAQPRLLGPLAGAVAQARGKPQQFGPAAARALIDGLAARLDETREISRYMVSLLIFLGLVGTFWGLLHTVSSIGEAIRNLTVAGNDFNSMFSGLKRGLEEPLTGMGTSFSSSLFGLSGSLILGFLELQASQAQSRFLSEVEDWLTANTRMGGSSFEGEGGGNVSAYVSALLETTAESLDKLQRTVARAEDGRSTVHEALVNLSERLGTLTSQMRVEQDLMMRIGEAQLEMKPLLQRLGTGPAHGGVDELSRAHLKNIDTQMARLIESQASGLDQVATQVKVLTRTIAAAMAQEGN